MSDVLTEKINNVEKNSKHWWAEMKTEITELKTQIENLPDAICKRMQETTDLKILNAVQCLENKLSQKEASTYRWIVGLAVGLIISLCGTAFNLLKG